MAANKNVTPAAALLMLLPLTMLRSMALAARHLPVGEAHLVLVPPFHGPIFRIPPPPATSASADEDDSPLRKVPRGPGHSPNDPSPPPPSARADDDDSPLRKVPRGPGHSPNDPSPPPPSAVAAVKLPMLVSEEAAVEDSIDGLEPAVED